MVVSALVSHYKPASRGLIRRGDQSTLNLDAPGTRRLTSTRSSLNLNNQKVSRTNSIVAPSDGRATGPSDAAANPSSSSAFHRRKRFRAMAFLTSAAADFDVIADWLYYVRTVKVEQEHFDSEGVHLIPYFILMLLLISCLFGTFAWLILATDGRVILPILKLFGVEGISTGYVLLFTVIIEDIPQIVLTFTIDDFYESDEISGFAMFNLCTSLYDIMIKIAESYDERHDIVETGAWCKETYYGHSECVTAVAALPLTTARRPPGAGPSTQEDSMIVGEGCMGMGIGSRQALTEAQEVSPLFLSGSWDGTVRLWDPCSASTRRKYVRKFKCHKDWVTCLCILGNNIGYARQMIDENEDEATVQSSKTFDSKTGQDNVNVYYFITGSRDGTIKLFNLSDKACVRTFSHEGSSASENACAVTCLASLDETAGSVFVSGHRDSTLKLWDTMTGECLRIYRGHERWITAICSLHDGSCFVSASDDGTAKLWDITCATTQPASKEVHGWRGGTLSIRQKASTSDVTDGNMEACTGLVAWNESSPSEIRIQAAAEETICVRTFRGHHGALFSVAPIEVGSTFVTGSADRTAKLWDADSGQCLRTFVGHLNGVSAVTLFDDNTILTGSFDKSARMYDLETGICLRSYHHHKDYVTAVATCHNGRTFLTASKDKTLKLWTVTAAASTQSLEQLIGENEV